MSNLPERPGLLIAGLTAACLLAFVVTIPLPRSDGQLVGSDGIRYFVYLPSWLVDHDLDFEDEYGHFFSSHPETVAYLSTELTPTGLPGNRFGIGPALLWSPFFVAAHSLALLSSGLGADVGTEGYGPIYQAAALAGSILYGGLGIWFCFLLSRRFSSQAAALVGSLVAILAGNSIYYLTVEPSMPHSLSLFASGAFFYLWMAVRHRDRWRDHLALGALAGLMALIRPQDGLFIALPILDEWLSAYRKGGSGAVRRGFQASLSICLAAFAVFTPQLMTWKLLNGAFLRSGYSLEFETLFRWPFPRLFAVLFSAERGLFVWHPVFLLAIVGLVVALRSGLADEDRRVVALFIFGIALQWFVVSSWHDWTQGDAFGGRMFIVCTPVFSVGLAVLLDTLSLRWSRRTLGIAAAILVVLNVLLLVQYRVELLGMQRAITYLDLTLGRFFL